MATFWLNGKLVEPNEAKVSLLDHGLLYGDGVFEGIRFYHGKAFMLEAHVKRLFHSAAAIMLKIPYDHSELQTGVSHIIQTSRLQTGYIRLVVTRGEGRLGIDPQNCHPNVFMIAGELTVEKTNSISAITASTRRVDKQSWDQRIKSLNYLNNVLAKLEAINSGNDEAILLNQQGNIAEGTISNIFMVRDNILFTPPVEDGALDGITRQVVLQLAQNLGIQSRQISLTPYDVYTAEECFLSGTGCELLSVASLDHRPLASCPGPVFLKIRKALDEYINLESAK